VREREGEREQAGEREGERGEGMEWSEGWRGGGMSVVREGEKEGGRERER